MDKKSKLKYLIIFLTIIILPIKVMALDSIDLKADKTELKAGEELTIKASLENPNSKAFLATLKYDEKVFEKIDSTAFTYSDGLVDITYNDSNNKFGIINKAINNENLFELHLKVKKDTNVGYTNIALTNITYSDGKTTYGLVKSSLKVYVTRDAKKDEELPTYKENQIEEDTNKSIKTFTNKPIVITLGVLSILLFIFIIYLKLKKTYKKKPFYILVILEIILIFTIFILLIINNNKKDVNKDGVIDYDDAKAIIEYLLDIDTEKSEEEVIESTEKKDNLKTSNKTLKVKNKKTASSKNLALKTTSSKNKTQKTTSKNNKKDNFKGSSDKDLNNDGKVDITDAGIVTDKTTEKTSVSLKEYDKENYALKGDITLKFKATIKPNGVKIKQVKIGNKYYNVKLNNDIYSVSIKTPNEAGKYEFTITDVICDNQKEVKTKLTFEREILKNVPTVSMFDLDFEQSFITFKLHDDEKALQDGQVYIYDDNDEEVKNVKLMEDNKIEYSFKEGKKYQLVVKATYDLDSELGLENFYENKEIFTHEFVFYKDYDFTLTDTSITDIIQKNEKPVVTFTSTNNKKAKVEVATLNNKEYNIQKIDGDNYTVEISDADTSFGKHTVTLDSVELSTLKKFENNKDYKTNVLTYSVLKEKPTVTNIKLEANKNNHTIKANFDITDKDTTINSLKAVLVDSTGKIVDTKIVSIEPSTNKTVELSYDKNSDGYYTVQFLADYTLGDKYKYTSTDIGKEDIAVLNDIHIEAINLKTTKYPTKGQKKYEIVFDVYVGDSVNQFRKDGNNNPLKYTRVSAVTINGLNYVAEEQTSNQPNIYKSRVSFTVPQESGIADIKANRVQLQYASYYIKYEDFYSVPLKEAQIDVLKDIPSIQNLNVVDDYENNSAIFDFDVVLDDKAIENDESFKSGSIELNNTKLDIKRGHNQVKFENIPKDQIFDAVFKASYDLDTDKLKEEVDQNEFNDKEIHKVKYGLFNPDIYDEITVDEIKVNSSKNNKYFEKNENINLNIKITGIDEQLSVEPIKVVIDNKEYALNKKDDGYEITLDGYNSYGIKDIVITDIILNNGRKVHLKKESKTNIEVLKDIGKITDFKYEILSNKDIKMTFVKKDVDKSIVSQAKVKIVDEDGNTIKECELDNEITFKPTTSKRYYVTVTANIDLDTDNTVDSDNYIADFKLLEEAISLDKNYIELKDINEISLYKSIMKSGDEETILVDEVTSEELEKNLDDYFVEINMDNLPSVRTRIKSVETNDNHLILVLDYKYVTKENSKELDNIRIDYGIEENGIFKNENHPQTAVSYLLKRLENNEDITLNQNYDFRYAKSSGNTYIENYTGHLNGNGYTIKNLSKTLFKNLKGEVENLNIFNVEFTDGQGALANTATNAKVTNVLVDKVTKKGTGSSSGGLIGSASSSIIENSKVTNVYLNLGYYDQSNGTFIGQMEKTEVRNCYAEGTINGGWNYTSGFIGNAKSSTLENNYVKVTALNLTENTHAAFAMAYQNAESIYRNNVSIASGISKTMIGSAKEVTNNYFYLSSNDQNETAGVTNIKKDQINQNLFENLAHFDEKIWDFKNASYSNLPTLQSEHLSVLSDTSNKEYKKENEILYKNLTKLMPFYNSDKIIESAINIKDSKLKNKEIVHILPVDKKGAIVNYLTTDDVKKISKIKVVFKDKDKEEYDVVYDNTYDMVVSYRIPSLKVDYNYNHYVIDASTQVVNNLTNYLKKLNYTNNLDILTSADDSRLYRDHYKEVTSKELKEFVLKFLSNSNYTNPTNDEKINNYIEREVKKDKKIEKVLYMYNYFSRWYRLDIDGMDLSDFMLFNMQTFDKSLTPIEIADKFLANDSNFNTGETNTKYAAIFGNYTNLKTLPEFLEYMVTEFSDETDMSKWTREHFSGYLVEIPVEGHSEVLYTLWDHFSHEDAAYNNPYKVYNFILPILTLPKNAAYIVSSPVQFVIGAQRTYIVNPEDPKDHKKLVDKIEVRRNRMQNYYNTAYGILDNAKLFNDIHTFHTDKRYAYDDNGILTYQQKGSTEEPFHKNYNEAIGQWAHSDGNNAVSWGDRIDWSVAGFLDSELKTDGTPDTSHTTYNTWSHESAHNIDARLFLKNNGRRYDGHGEDYADNNLTQAFNQKDIVMNLSINFRDDQKIGSNLKPERINTKDKIWSYYRRLFDTVYVMDYIEALAFLKLEPKDQATIAVQASYPNASYADGKDEEKYLTNRETRYTELTAEDFENMQLKTVDDLIKNKIMIQPGIYKISTRGVSSYGGEGLNTVHWYQPNNPYGRPDSYSLKWLAYEMLGYKGYDNGYVEYYSNINSTPFASIKNYKTDNMAIKRISEEKYNNFDEYKYARFNEVKSKLSKLNKEVNVKAYVQKFSEELKKDAEFERTSLEELFKNKTEEACLKDYWCLNGSLAKAIEIPYSTQVRYDIFYKLKSTTNDFMSDIYAKEEQQDISDLLN